MLDTSWPLLQTINVNKIRSSLSFHITKKTFVLYKRNVLNYLTTAGQAQTLHINLAILYTVQRTVYTNGVVSFRPTQ